MNVRHQRAKDEIQLQMTPMIDVVFQLLAFFILTFKIVTAEGDFNVRMPQDSAAPGPVVERVIPPLHVRLEAGSRGELSHIALNRRRLDSFESLRDELLGLIGADSPASGESPEVELDCDDNLRYEHVIEAITAVSGYRDDATGEIVKLVEKIKFAPPKNPPS
jgi:biopolymer transport protein ExbD